ncbi:MAG: hypothetical protein IPK15_06575 [Verrucomicrobia bacterium]|nr:hypothetical protein [Verrucomicrobiota bacterium]
MNDKHALGTRLLDDVVHRPGQFADATRRGFAPMVIPHIADNNCGALRIPRCLLFGDGIRNACHRPASRARAQRQFEGSRGGIRETIRK